MKRCILLILALAMMIPLVSFADQDILVSGSQQEYDYIEVVGHNILQYEDKYGNKIYILYVLRNTGRRPIQIDNNHCSIQFYDKSGRMYYEYKGSFNEYSDPSLSYYYMGLWPYTVEPGQYFYLSRRIWEKNKDPRDDEAYRQIVKAANYKLNLTLMPQYDPKDLYKYSKPSIPVSGRYSFFTETNDYGTEFPRMNLTMTVTNDTSETAEDVRVACIIWDDNGKPVAIEDRTYYDANIGAYQSKEFKEDFMFYDQLDFFKKYNFQIKNVELMAFID